MKRTKGIIPLLFSQPYSCLRVHTTTSLSPFKRFYASSPSDRNQSSSLRSMLENILPAKKSVSESTITNSNDNNNNNNINTNTTDTKQQQQTFYYRSTKTEGSKVFRKTKPASDELKTKQWESFKQPEHPKILTVSLVGPPNAGKSTLVNNLISKKVSSVSPKAQTTRGELLGIMTLGDAQIQLLDTPGVVPQSQMKRYGRDITNTAWRVAAKVDMMIVIFDVLKRIGEQEKHILYMLLKNEEFKKIPSILLFNKMDSIDSKSGVLLKIKEMETIISNLHHGIIHSKDKQLKDPLSDVQRQIQEQVEITNQLEAESKASEDAIKQVTNTEEKEQDDLKSNKGGKVSNTSASSQESSGETAGLNSVFKEVFYVSAQKNLCVDDVKQYLISRAKPGNWQYPPTWHTNQSEVQVMEQVFKDKLYLYVNKEVPHRVVMNNVGYEVSSKGEVWIEEEIFVERTSQLKILSAAKKILCKAVEEELGTLLGRIVRFSLSIKVQKPSMKIDKVTNRLLSP